MSKQPMEWQQGNLRFAANNGVLLVEIDISADARAKASPSKTGKTKLLGTTNGWLAIPGSDGVRVSINVTAPLPK